MGELLLGCGNSRVKQITMAGSTWNALTTLDLDGACKPDIQHNLNIFPLPFEDEQFDELHAYEVLEHTGIQGDINFFFSQWYEFWRILKPDGIFCGSVPLPDSAWAWGDPSHRRVIPIEQLHFLSQSFYDQVGTTAASDFRGIWKGDFQLLWHEKAQERQLFVLKKITHG